MSALWKHSCSSVVGTKHLSQGTLCEDASCAFWDDDTQTLFLAVADGAGSVEEAATGAQEVIKAFQERAVDLVLELSQQDLDNKIVLRNLLIELANYLRVRLEILANSSGSYTSY